MTKHTSITESLELDLTAAERTLRSKDRLLVLAPELAHDAGAVANSSFLFTLARGARD